EASSLSLSNKLAFAKPTFTHSIERPDSKLIGAVSEGLPMVISNLKSLLGTRDVCLSSAAAKINHGKRETTPHARGRAYATLFAAWCLCNSKNDVPTVDLTVLEGIC